MKLQLATLHKDVDTGESFQIFEALSYGGEGKALGVVIGLFAWRAITNQRGCWFDQVDPFSYVWCTWI